MLKTFQVKLDVEKELYSSSEILFSVSENDFDSIQVEFEIRQDDNAVDLTGKTVELAIQKPSGLVVYTEVEITNALEGKGIVKLPVQAYVEYGIHSAEVNIRDAETMVVTSPFWFKSREGILGTEEIESSNDWSAIQKALFLYDLKPILTEGVPPTQVPEYVGQTALDTVNNLFYIANGTTADSWVAIIQTDGGTGTVSWETILNKPLLFPSEPHSHEIADVTGLQLALDSKVDEGTPPDAHSHTIADVTGLQGALDGKADGNHNHDTLYSPIGHSHDISNVNGLQTALDGKVDDSEMASKSDVGHSHGFDEITGKPLSYPPDVHTHGFDEITGKPLSYPPDAHGHTIADVSGLQAELDSKADAGTGVQAHTHLISEVDGLQLALDGKVDDAEMSGKADINHTHDFADIQNKPISYPPDAHNHAIADVTGLQGALDSKVDDTEMAGKSDVGHSHGFEEITGKPLTYPPDAHSHDFADITGKPTSYPPDVHTHDFNTGITGKPATYPPDVHSHGWDEITGKPTTFTPPLASGTEVGGHRVGNGLSMVGEYLTVREGAGINVSDTNYSVEIDRTTTDTWYAKAEQMNGLTLWKGTQSQYDAIATKDPNTLYFIV